MFDYKQRIISKEAGDNYDRIFKQGEYADNEPKDDVCEKELKDNDN